MVLSTANQIFRARSPHKSKKHETSGTVEIFSGLKGYAESGSKGSLSAFLSRVRPELTPFDARLRSVTYIWRPFVVFQRKAVEGPRTPIWVTGYTRNLRALLSLIWPSTDLKMKATAAFASGTIRILSVLEKSGNLNKAVQRLAQISDLDLM